MKIREKTCKVCKTKFTPTRTFQPTCEDIECRVKFAVMVAEKAKVKREKVEKSWLRARREAVKTRSDWAKEAQAAVNAFVRERDKDLPCISCGRYHQGQWHAGHYLSRGAHPELSLEPKNIFKQCQPCNTHLSGNQIKMRQGIIARHGQERVIWLEGPHPAKKHTIDDLKAIRDLYKTRLKELKAKSPTE